MRFPSPAALASAPRFASPRRHVFTAVPQASPSPRLHHCCLPQDKTGPVPSALLPSLSAPAHATAKPHFLQEGFLNACAFQVRPVFGPLNRCHWDPQPAVEVARTGLRKMQPQDGCVFANCVSGFLDHHSPWKCVSRPSHHTHLHIDT